MLARLLLCLSLLALALPAHAEGRMFRKPFKHKMMWKSLDLSQEQRDKLFALQQKLESVTFGHRQAKEAASYELHNRLRAPSFDDGATSAAVDKIVAAEKELLTARIEFVKEMRTILKPEQLKKLHERQGVQETPAP